MIKFRNEEGLTLIELLVVIALVGIVAAISLPILLNTVENAQNKADDTSAAEVENFTSDWTTAGYLLVQGQTTPATGYEGATDAKKIYAFANDGKGVPTGGVAAQITGVLVP